jgi:hypothetical protein
MGKKGVSYSLDLLENSTNLKKSQIWTTFYQLKLEITQRGPLSINPFCEASSKRFLSISFLNLSR